MVEALDFLKLGQLGGEHVKLGERVTEFLVDYLFLQDPDFPLDLLSFIVVAVDHLESSEELLLSFSITTWTGTIVQIDEFLNAFGPSSEIVGAAL